MKNIFIGTVDIAGQIPLLKQGLEYCGHSIVTAKSKSGGLFSDKDFDIIIDNYEGINYRYIRPRRLLDYLNFRYGKKSKVFAKLILDCDIFIFFWSTFSAFYNDLEILKRLGKKIVIFHVGSDVRWYSAMKQEFMNHSLHPIVYPSTHRWGVKDLSSKLNWLRSSEKYADIIFSQPNQAQLALRPYFNFFVPIDIKLFEEPIKSQRIEPVIVHAPTLPIAKGTDIILHAIDKLHRDGVNFKFILIENKFYAEALKIYKNCDIIIDQLYIPGGGKLTREGMALGKVVMTNIGNQNNYEQGMVNKAPIVDINIKNLYEKLKSTIVNVDYRNRISSEAREYAKANHSSISVAKRLLDLNNDTEQKYDFYPTFFRNEFNSENYKYSRIYNKWTRFVSDCEWYKKHVIPGKRNGLIF